jgi:hypothetical protein
MYTTRPAILSVHHSAVLRFTNSDLCGSFRNNNNEIKTGESLAFGNKKTEERITRRADNSTFSFQHARLSYGLMWNRRTEQGKMGSEDARWMKLAQDRVQWRALVLAVLNLRVLLPESVN